MKSLINFHKVLLLCLVLKCNFTLAQSPPSQGPPVVDRNKPFERINVNTVIQLFKNQIINDILLVVNDNLRRQTSGLSVSLSKLTKSNPYFSNTDNYSSPNEKIIILPLKVDYELHLPNLPNRHLFHNIKIIFSCNNWFINTGGFIKVLIDADAIYLDNPSLTENVINTLTLGEYTRVIDSKIKEKLRNNSGEFTTLLNLGNLKCNCLSYNRGVPFLDNSSIEYQYNRPSLAPNTNPFNPTKVSLVSVRRLNAKNLENNTVLYKEIENLTFEVYVNQKIMFFENITMREGETYIVPSNSIVINRPKKLNH